MLFNSYIFIFAFLPITLTGFWLLGRTAGRGSAIAWLALASLVYYGYWNPIYLVLISASMSFNFSIGYVIGKAAERGAARKAWTVFGVAANLALLGYFKYANFFVDSVNMVFDTGWTLEKIVLPLGISFFTFQQIAYIVDAYKGFTHEYSFVDYVLFVTFFPQLIAGPIVHHKDMMPQFSQLRAFSYTDFAAGMTMFTMGLFKKVLIADSVSRYATPAYNALLGGHSITSADAWTAAFSFSFQMYFDFSAYSDMAIGLGLLFGIRLPINFNSPYKAHNTGELWRRWHITLSNFLRDYLYIPLGGNRSGLGRHYFALMATMVLSGIWHGAGWTFVLFGILHGLYHWVYITWTHIKERANITIDNWATRGAAIALTYFAWTVAITTFRAENMTVAIEMYKSMFGWYGFEGEPLMRIDRALVRLLLCGLIVWTCPNTNQIMARVEPVVHWARVQKTLVPAFWPMRRIVWVPNAATALLVGGLAFYTIAYIGRRTSEFLYFQF